MKKVISLGYAIVPLLLAGIALAAKKPAPNDILFVIQDSKQMVSMNPQTRRVTWYAPKDDVARQLLAQIAEDNNKIAELQGRLQFFTEFVEQGKVGPIFKKYVAARQAALNKTKSAKK